MRGMTNAEADNESVVARGQLPRGVYVFILSLERPLNGDGTLQRCAAFTTRAFNAARAVLSRRRAPVQLPPLPHHLPEGVHVEKGESVLLVTLVSLLTQSPNATWSVKGNVASGQSVRV